MNRLPTIFLFLVLTFFGSPLPVQAGHFDHFSRMKPAKPKKAASSFASSIPVQLIDVRYKTCPITGNAPLETVAIIFNGKVYHFCHETCAKVFKRKSKSIVSQIKAAKEVPLTVTNKDGLCPVNGLPAKTDIFLTHGNSITFYCSPACAANDGLQPIH